MSDAEYQSAFSIWVIGASPLMIDADIRNMSAFQRRTLLHEGMLEIHSDPLATGGSRVGSCVSAGDCQVWVKQLAGNESAVSLLNLADTPEKVGFSFALLGYPSNVLLAVRDVMYSGESICPTNPSICPCLGSFLWHTYSPE
jgi:hypothetical protein